MVVRRIKRKVRTGPATGLLAAAAVCLLVAAAPANATHGPIIHPTNVGGGVMSGKATFTTPAAGVPGVGQTCGSSVVTVEAEAPMFALNTVLTGYLGPIDIEAQGSSNCETAASGQGDIVSATVTGTGPTGSEISCPSMTGEYSRIGTVAIVQVTGDCIVNLFSISDTSIVGTLVVVPTESDYETLDPEAGRPDDPTTTDVNESKPVKYGRLDGPFVVVPAS